MENQKGLFINLEEEKEEHKELRKVFNILSRKPNYLHIKEQYSMFMTEFKNENRAVEGFMIRFFRSANIILQFCKESSDEELIRLAEGIEKGLSRSSMARNPDMNSYGFKESLKMFFNLKIGREQKSFDIIYNSINKIGRYVNDMLKSIEDFEKKTNCKMVEVGVNQEIYKYQ
ncbi:hypothetical protein [Bacillus thuringiensis]|uniref:hypothetical protein n=1 Tax=Bacillus thuringiensis TaxID=1428 RepID=UPI0021D65B9A|nr:hypothetical protein [Bacillus thuringiensis]MCU7667719.1 hypothetical protein [Bacillus thuringiensis]